MNTNLKVLLVKKGVKNFDIAKHLDCDPAKISKIINGWIEPDDITKKRIAEYLQTESDSIFSRG